MRTLHATLVLTLALSSSLAAQTAAPRVSGYLQVRETYQSDTGLTASLHRARLGVDGTLPGRFSYKLTAEYQAAATPATGSAAVSMRDAYIRWDDARFSVQAGQFKTPFSWSYTTSLTVIETADRPTVIDSLATKRDVGLMGRYDLGTASVSFGVFNGEGQNHIVNRDSTVLAAGRVTVRAIPALLLGADYAAYGPDSSRYGLEAMLEQRALVLRAEYLAQSRRLGGVPDRGYYVLAGYRLQPRLQVVLQQEDFERPGVNAAQNNMATTVGLTADLAGGVRLTTDYVSRAIGSPAVRHGEAIAQLQVVF